MGKYTVIAEVSQELVRSMQEALVPELVSGPEGICLCSPEEAQDCSLGIFLYDIQENDEMRRFAMTDLDEGRQRGAPAVLSLYYMFTAYSNGDRKFGTVQEQRILGRVIQHFHDHPLIREQIQMQLLKLSTEDKTKMWNFSGKPYRMSLYYRASPAVLESGVIRNVTRVREVQIHAKGVSPVAGRQTP